MLYVPQASLVAWQPAASSRSSFSFSTSPSAKTPAHVCIRNLSNHPTFGNTAALQFLIAGFLVFCLTISEGASPCMFPDFFELLSHQQYGRQKTLFAGQKNYYLLGIYTPNTAGNFAIFNGVIIEAKIKLPKYRKNSSLHLFSSPMEMDNRNTIAEDNSTDRTFYWFTKVGADKTNEYVSSSFTCSMGSYMLLLVARLSVSTTVISC